MTWRCLLGLHDDIGQLVGGRLVYECRHCGHTRGTSQVAFVYEAVFEWIDRKLNGR